MKIVDENLFYVTDEQDLKDAMHKAGFYQGQFTPPENIVYPSLCTFFLSNNDIAGYQVVCRHWQCNTVFNFLGDW